MDLYIKGVPPTATNRSTAKLMKTGQTTSYRTGDDGDLEAGRNVSFSVLAENNVFGNTNRFTDELGTQTYTKNIVIDWSTYDGSTVLGFRRSPINGGTWNAAIDTCLALSIAPFTTGWRMANIVEFNNLANYSLSFVFNYSPFNTTGSFITSTTYSANTAQCYQFLASGTVTTLNKTSSTNYLPVRNFTVTGTTLS